MVHISYSIPHKGLCGFCFTSGGRELSVSQFPTYSLNICFCLLVLTCKVHLQTASTYSPKLAFFYPQRLIPHSGLHPKLCLLKTTRDRCKGNASEISGRQAHISYGTKCGESKWTFADALITADTEFHIWERHPKLSSPVISLCKREHGGSERHSSCPRSK